MNKNTYKLLQLKANNDTYLADLWLKVGIFEI